MLRRPPQIVAVGGGGNVVIDPDRQLDAYILRATGRAKPRVCFLPTATGDSDAYVARYYASFATHQCLPARSAVSPHTRSPQALLTQDLIRGGEHQSMLATCERDCRILHRAWRSSSPASCGRHLVRRRHGSGLMPGAARRTRLAGGTCCPHYDGNRSDGRRCTRSREMAAHRQRWPLTTARPRLSAATASCRVVPTSGGACQVRRQGRGSSKWRSPSEGSKNRGPASN
jgi:hypothetical protein